MNYFAIERGNRFFEVKKNNLCSEPEHLVSDELNFVNMTYEEMKSSEHLEKFVVLMMELVNQETDGEDEETSVTLVGEDGVFIWGIIMGPGDDGDIRYCLVDWHKDGKNYRYSE